MTNEEEQMLDEALIRTCGKFGITHDNDSVYEGPQCRSAEDEDHADTRRSA